MNAEKLLTYKDKGYVFSGELGPVINKEPLTLRASDIMDFGVSRIVSVDLIKRMVLSVNEEREISLLDYNSPVEIYSGVFINLGEVLEGV